MRSRILRTVALGFVLLSCSANARSNRAIVEDFARLFYVKRDVRAAFEKYVAPDYIQHNPGLPDGREAAIVALTPKFANPVASFSIKRILVDGDLAVIHVHAKPDRGSRGAAVVDIYRFHKGRIVEHWDVIQPIPETSKNAHPMF